MNRLLTRKQWLTGLQKAIDEFDWDAAFNNTPVMWERRSDGEKVVKQEIPESEAYKQEPVAWHHPDCEGECIACLIEREVEAQYGTHGLAYLRRYVYTTPPVMTKVKKTNGLVVNDET